jgi:hypothetical protein
MVICCDQSVFRFEKDLSREVMPTGTVAGCAYITMAVIHAMSNTQIFFMGVDLILKLHTIPR